MPGKQQIPGLNLAALEIVRKLGEEQFSDGDRNLGFDLLDFWRWCSSDLANNAMRGVIAECLVAQALGTAHSTRTEWDAYDVKSKQGVKVEVKSAAYLQSWHQDKYSDIGFSVAPKQAWDYKTNTWSKERKRQADVYVFALLKHIDKPTLNPMNVEQWSFYVLPTVTLNEHLPAQERIGLTRLRSLGPREAQYGELASVIEGMFPQQDSGEGP